MFGFYNSIVNFIYELDLVLKVIISAFMGIITVYGWSKFIKTIKVEKFKFKWGMFIGLLLLTFVTVFFIIHAY